MQKFTEFVNEQKLQRIAKSKEEQAHKFNDLYESKLRQFGVSSPIELNEEQSTEFFEYVKTISKNSLEVNEAEKFKSTKDFEEFLEEIDGMPEVRIRRIMGKDYIDTPGGYQDEAEDYDNDIVEYTISNMGKKEYEKLKSWWENNVAESVVNEGDMTKSYDGFIVLNSKNQEMYKFKYIKGISNVKVEVDAINKLVKATGLNQANFAVHGFVKKGEWNSNDAEVLESVVNEGRIKAPKALEDIVNGDTSRAEGIKMSKKLADHYLMWLRTSAYGKKQGKDLPLDMVIKASFNWGIERGLDPKLNAELAKLKGMVNESESLELNEADIKSEKDFKEYAETVLRKAHGDDYDQKIADKVISGIAKDVKGDDWGAAVGKLTSSLGK